MIVLNKSSLSMKFHYYINNFDDRRNQSTEKETMHKQQIFVPIGLEVIFL